MPDNVRRGRPQGKRHRKQTARRSERSPVRVRVKGCGKSAPRRRQRRRHGKPHREQDRIGATGRVPAWLARHPTRFRAVARVDRSRRPATVVPEEWSSRAGGSPPAPYRTRLTGRLAPDPLPPSDARVPRFRGGARSGLGSCPTAAWDGAPPRHGTAPHQSLKPPPQRRSPAPSRDRPVDNSPPADRRDGGDPTRLPPRPALASPASDRGRRLTSFMIPAVARPSSRGREAAPSPFPSIRYGFLTLRGPYSTLAPQSARGGFR